MCDLGASAKAGKGAASAAAAPAAAAAAAAEEDWFSQLDVRVGHVVEVSNHPNADKIYVEKIDLGEATGPRTILSGLREFVKPEDFKGA